MPLPTAPAVPSHPEASQARLDALRDRLHRCCVITGPDNPVGLKLKFKVLEDGSVRAMFPCAPHLESYSNTVHGAIIAAVLDSAMVNALFAIGIVAVTASLDVRYRAPTVPNRFATVRAWIESDDARPLYRMRAELIQDGTTRVQATANFLVSEGG
jgi:acyl-coenzyme A thioesterase PaaI-like protein